MEETQKNGAPDIWYGGRLYEAKQGKDRLSEDQRIWHRHYYAAHGEWPRIAFFPDSGCAKGCIFQNYMEFEQSLADSLRISCYTTPELLAIYKAAYPSTIQTEEITYEDTEIQAEKFIPTFNESVWRGRENNNQEQQSEGTGRRDYIPECKW